jgi:prolyl-tRNA editing enzyme YbaK/EbsC (Cys-tRNA(Pro) deacylase)
MDFPAIYLLSKLRIPCQLILHKDYGRKAEEVAPLFGVGKNDALKVLTFLSDSGKACLVILPKNSEVDEEKLSDSFGEKLRLAKSPEVRKITGEEIGGVTPFGKDLPVFIDSSCLQKKFVLVSAGVPDASIKLAGADLAKALPKARLRVF